MGVISSKLIATAQVLLSILFIGGYFLVLSEFIHGRINVPSEWKDTLQSLLSLLTGGVLIILHYWFSRSRPDSKDDNN